MHWSLGRLEITIDFYLVVVFNSIGSSCRYASALSVLAENRKLLEQIFVTKEYSENGVYAMKLCKDGQWTDVIVDDRFPCLANGTLAFCKVKHQYNIVHV